MAVTKANTLQSFEWFKNLLGEDIDKKIAKATGYTLKPATTDELGGIVVGEGLAIDDGGILDVTISGGDKNVIEAITLDGKNQPPVNKTVNLSLSAYAKKTDLAGALSSISSLSVGDKNVIEAITLDGNPQPVTNKTVNLSMSAYIKKTDFGSGVRVKGSVKYFSDLPTDAEVGDLYNIQTSGGVDGEGVEIVAGDNVVFTSKGTWDVMAGFIDTSIFVRKVHGKDLSSNDFTDALKAKLEGLSSYNIPTASKTQKGIVMIGAGLSITDDGVLSTNGQDNVIEAITLDGKNQPPVNKTVNLSLSAYAKKTDLAGALSSINSLSLAIGGLSNCCGKVKL